MHATLDIFTVAFFFAELHISEKSHLFVPLHVLKVFANFGNPAPTWHPTQHPTQHPDHWQLAVCWAFGQPYQGDTHMDHFFF